LKKTIKDSVIGKSGYQCAPSDYSEMGKILFGQVRTA